MRRPISICKIDREQGTLRLVIEVRGKGTEEICSMKAGDKIDLIAPLGHGFELLDRSKKAIVVGGGIGSAPLLEVAGNYGKNCKAILGFRDSGTVVLEQDYIALGAETIICTDNGTKGFHGFTTQMLDKQLSESTADIIYACGPKPMLKGVAELAARYKIRCQLSMDERMACGIGACLGCACKTKKPDG
ncbi:MAG: dihydroorotate dehydrogenase electron transfer subunit, partial [Oscillospiraceae bacterium]